MKSLIARSWMAVFLMPVAFAAEEAAGPVYVQAVKIELKAEPRMDAKKVTELVRGDSLEVLRKQDNWLQVKVRKNSGWVSRLFVTSHKPVGSAELSKQNEMSLEKANRRRSSAIGVSAATRGLIVDNRVREGREAYSSDFDGLAEMEGRKVSPEELQKFQRAVRLGN